MAEPDFSNPLVVVTAFFSLFGTTMIFFVKIIQLGVAGGLIAGLVGFAGMGLVYAKTLK